MDTALPDPRTGPADDAENASPPGQLAGETLRIATRSAFFFADSTKEVSSEGR